MVNAIRRLLAKVFGFSGVASPPLAPAGTVPPGAPDLDGNQHLTTIRQKLDLLADDFAHGRLNRPQYEELYEHYQRQKRMIENLQRSFGDSEEARRAIAEGRSLIIRRQNQADVLAFAIYANDSSVPLYTYGQFLMDSALVVGMLGGLRDASREMLGARLRKTEVEDGKVLCFFGGMRTTLLVLYSIDPSPRQVDALKQVHQEFETNNQEALAKTQIDPESLMVPLGRIIGVGPKLSQLAGV